MKKAAIIAIILLSFITFQSRTDAAESVSKSLEKAGIEIISDGSGGYEVNQEISLIGEGDFSGNTIEHTFSKINNVKPENLQFFSGENELEFTVEESETLVRYNVTIPEGTSESFDYAISYTTHLEDGIFTTPLFVPLHPAAGKSNVVEIEFKTTEGNIIQRNSFPILKKAEDHEVTSYLMNIPSHVNYIYGPEKNITHSYNLISWAALFILLSIVTIWIRSELKTNKGVGA